MQTPKVVVREKGKGRPYRYEPAAEKRYPIPVMLVYALILPPYLLYLLPGNGFVEYLVGEGFSVYLLGWDVPESEDSGLSFGILHAGGVGPKCSLVATEEPWPRTRDRLRPRLGGRT